MTNEDIIEVVGLVYHEWSQAAEKLEFVKRETKSEALDQTDWEDMHEERLLRAVVLEDKWRGIKDRIIEEFRDPYMKSLGF